MKFSKIAALIMSLSIAGVALCACNNQVDPVSSDINVISTQSQNGGVNNGETEETGYIDPNAANTNFKFTYKGVDLIINTAIDESKFSKDDYEAQEQADCGSEGFVLLYIFKGGSFEILTRPTDGKDSINEITIKDDTVSTAEGIYIGNTLDQVKAVYGEPSNTYDGGIEYVKGSSKLVFYFDDTSVSTNPVTEIRYLQADN